MNSRQRKRLSLIHIYIGPIEHDPFILISYLSAKYEEFTFEQVKPELDALFAEQYHLTTEAVNETVTETATVRVGESLGQVVTSGYCNCCLLYTSETAGEIRPVVAKSQNKNSV